MTGNRRALNTAVRAASESLPINRQGSLPEALGICACANAYSA